MSDLEEFAKQLGKDKIKELLLTSEETLFCAYGGGNCIISRLNAFIQDGDADKIEGFVKEAYCTRARQVRWKFLEAKKSHAERLNQAGCPNSNYGFFGWDFKYADGHFHNL